MTNTMTLSEELSWRGFVNQTTYKDMTALDNGVVTFYWGVDPSADSMTIGNLAIAMMVRLFVEHGHKAYLLVGGATGLIGDPDGKSSERELKSKEEIDRNKARLTDQYHQIFAGQSFEIVDNYDWFKDMHYLDFLRDVGKHVPMRQMLGREFVQNRLSEDGAGISYAEFSYSLIQGYDYLHLHREHGVNLQVCGADQWGNCIAGVELIRRVTGDEAHIWSAPLVINQTTGVKFGKTEDGAVWLDASKTSAYKFYQFWVTLDDEGVEDYLKLYTMLDKPAIESVMAEFNRNRAARHAQRTLAYEVTKIVHGEEQADKQRKIAEAVVKQDLSELSEEEQATLSEEMPKAQTNGESDIVNALVDSGLAGSKTEARRLLTDNAISVNGAKVNRDYFEPGDFQNGRLLLRKGKAFKDSVLIELTNN